MSKSISDRLEELKVHLRNKHRIKYGADYTILISSEQLHILCVDAYTDAIIEHFRSFDIAISTLSIIGKREW